MCVCCVICCPVSGEYEYLPGNFPENAENGVVRLCKHLFELIGHVCIAFVRVYLICCHCSCSSAFDFFHNSCSSWLDMRSSHLLNTNVVANTQTTGGQRNHPIALRFGHNPHLQQGVAAEARHHTHRELCGRCLPQPLSEIVRIHHLAPS